MAFCKNCGASLVDGKKFCPGCGSPVDANSPSGGAANNNAEEKTYDFSDKISQFTRSSDHTGEFSREDILNNKFMAVLSYIGPLVIIPILAAKNSRYARFHANQGLVLFIFDAAWSIVYSIIKNIFYAISFSLGSAVSIIGIASILFLVLMIMGIINAASGSAKRLPLIGNIILIK